MSTFAPSEYVCPICLGNQGKESEQTMLLQADQVFQDDLVPVWINSLWVRGNEGHVIVVPTQHFESLFDLPERVGHRIFDLSRLLAHALREVYRCDGITLRQNNGPEGDQHAFHYHLHIFPRYLGDTFNEELTRKSFLANPSERAARAGQLRAYLKEKT